MKKISKVILFLSLSLGLLFSGCSLSSNSGANENGLSIGIGSGSNSGGSSSTSGIIIKLDDNYPPSEMLEMQPYTFALSIENYMNYPINDLVIKPIGFDKSLVQGFDTEYTKSQIPTKTRDKYGYSQLVISGVQSVDLSRDYNFNPTFKYVYTAHTDYIEQVCIPDKMNKCQIKIDKFSSQTGPVTVKVDRISSLKNNIRIDFKVQNSGSGFVVNSENKFKTDEYVTKFNLNEVKLGSTSGNCHSLDGGSDFQLMKQSGNFYCEFSRNSDESYATQLIVKLNYVYNDKVSKRIVVKDMNQQ